MTAVVADYNQILVDLVGLISANMNDIDAVTEEQLDLAFETLNKRRHIDLRLISSDDAVRAGNEYVSNVMIEATVAVYDLSSYRDAARVRNDLVKELKTLVRNNQRFTGDALSTITRRTGFAEGEVERGFISVAVVEIVVEVYEGG